MSHPSGAGLRAEAPDSQDEAVLSGTATGKLAPGEQRVYRIPAAAAHYYELELEAAGIEFKAVVLAPDGQETAVAFCIYDETARLVFVAAAAGSYRLILSPIQATGRGGSFRITIRKAKEAGQPLMEAVKFHAEGQKLRLTGTAESVRSAIEAYRKALALYESLSDREGQVEAYRDAARACQEIGENEASLEYYKRSLTACRAGSSSGCEEALLSELSQTYLLLGMKEEAESHAQEALKLARERGNERATVSATINIGEQLYDSGDIPAALARFEEALSRADTINHQRGIALAYLNMGRCLADMDSISRAADALERSLSLWRSVKDRRREAQSMTGLMQLHLKTGEYLEAIRLYHQGRELYESLEDPVALGAMLNNVGYAYSQINRSEDSLNYYREALSVFQRAGYQTAVAYCHLLMGRTYLSFDEIAAALEHLEQAMSIFVGLGDLRMQARTILEIGSVHAALGVDDQALESYKRALSLDEQGNYKRGQAYTLNTLGRFYERHGQKPSAAECYQKALRLNREVMDPFGESVTLYNLAHVEGASGDSSAALQHIESALGLVESLRVKIPTQDLRASYSSSVQDHYELYVDLRMQQHRKDRDGKWDAQALLGHERGRSRSLIELLREAGSDLRQGIEPELLGREGALRQMLNLREGQRMQLLGRSHTPEEAARLAAEIRELNLEYEQLQAQIRIQSPRYAALTQPRPFDLETIQQTVVDDQTLLLEYALGDERSYLWAVDKKEMTSYVLPPKEEIEALARKARESLTARQQPLPEETMRQFRLRAEKADAQYWETATRLSQILLQPAAHRLSGRRLLIVPDGLLQYLPFSALPCPPQSLEPAGSRNETPGLVPLIARHEIVRLPSASSLGVLRQEMLGRRPARKSVAVFADPVFESDDPRLRGCAQSKNAQPPAPHTEPVDAALRGFQGIGRLSSTLKEANAIVSVVTGGDAFKAIGLEASRDRTLSADLSHYRIIHFATHGIINDEHPNLSAVVLSTYDPQCHEQNGFLRLHDIYNLHLPAELVVLSACETALGKDVRGEGLIGLVRGFMYAGAARVVASLWKVQDDSTAQLMKVFYQKMLREGHSPAAALRDAQVEMWRHRLYSPPYYWAGFVLQGEYR